MQIEWRLVNSIFSPLSDSASKVTENNSNSSRRKRRRTKSSKRHNSHKKSTHWTKKYIRKGSGRNGNARLNRARGDPIRRRMSAKHDRPSHHEGPTLPPLILPPNMRGGIPSSDADAEMETDEEGVPMQQGSTSSLPFLYQQQYQSNGQVPTFLPSIRYRPQQPMSVSSSGSSSSHVLPRVDADRFKQSPPVRSFSGRLFDDSPHQHYYRDYRQPSSTSILSQEIQEILSPSSVISEEDEDSLSIQDQNPVTWLQTSEDKRGYYDAFEMQS